MTTNENEIDTDQVSIYHATPLVPAKVAHQAVAAPMEAAHEVTLAAPEVSADAAAEGSVLLAEGPPSSAIQYNIYMTKFRGTPTRESPTPIVSSWSLGVSGPPRASSAKRNDAA